MHKGFAGQFAAEAVEGTCSSAVGPAAAETGASSVRAYLAERRGPRESSGFIAPWSREVHCSMAARGLPSRSRGGGGNGTRGGGSGCTPSIASTAGRATTTMTPTHLIGCGIGEPGPAPEPGPASGWVQFPNRPVRQV